MSTCEKNDNEMEIIPCPAERLTLVVDWYNPGPVIWFPSINNPASLYLVLNQMTKRMINTFLSNCTTLHFWDDICCQHPHVFFSCQTNLTRVSMFIEENRTSGYSYVWKRNQKYDTERRHQLATFSAFSHTDIFYESVCVYHYIISFLFGCCSQISAKFHGGSLGNINCTLLSRVCNEYVSIPVAHKCNELSVISRKISPNIIKDVLLDKSLMAWKTMKRTM